MEGSWLVGGQQSSLADIGDGDVDDAAAALLGLGSIGVGSSLGLGGGVGEAGGGVEVEGVDLDLDMEADQVIDPFALAELGHVVSERPADCISRAVGGAWEWRRRRKGKRLVLVLGRACVFLVSQ